jgi:hypothetical protein
VFQLSSSKMVKECGSTPNLLTEFSVIQSADPLDPLRFKQLSRAEWMDLIKGLGFVEIEQAIAIYPAN